MKPTVFNYQEYERVVEENKKLNAEVADLRIRCRIADGDKRDCKSCKHQKADGCSRWECEYEPVMSDLIKKSDAIKALYKYNFVSKNVIEREINAIPSADAVEVVRCKDCVYCTVQNTKYLYAICQRHGIEFKPFEDDTRTHFCAWGERREL